MGDEYDYDVDEGYDYDDGWMYVEDGFSLVDELAEGAVPDPGYAGTANELAMERYDYDFYAYWDDIEYADDGYWDEEGAQPRAEQQESAQQVVGGKRKRAGDAGAAKRRKVSDAKAVRGRTGEVDANSVGDGVSFIARSERLRREYAPAPPLRKGKAYALLPDWRQRFADDDGEVKPATMPADMRQAAEAPADDTPPKAQHADALVENGGEEDWEDDDDEEAADGEDGAAGIAGLDTGTLQAILQRKLREAGLSGVDESAFMASIGKMLAGEEVDGDATGELANMLLGRAGGDSAVAGFLSGQGVSLGDDDEEEDVDGEEEDSGISGLDTSPAGAVGIGGRLREMPLRSGSPEVVIKAKSRKGAKKVTFDVPPADTEKAEQNGQQEALPTLPSSSNDHTVVATESTKPSTTAKTRAKTRNSAAYDSNHGVRAASPGAQLQRELDGASDAPSVPQSRKRKANAVVPEDGDTNDERMTIRREEHQKRPRSAAVDDVEARC